MKKARISLIALALVAYAAAAAAQSVVPDAFLRGYDPITVSYPGDASPGRGPADGPGEFLSVSPAVGGEYRWLDARTVQFLPSRPWPALSRFRVRYKGGERVLTTMVDAPTSITPRAGAEELEPVSVISLSFASPLDAADLAKMIRIELRDLPGLEAAGATWISSPDFSIREIESARGRDSSAFTLKLREAVPYGKKITVHLALSLDPAIPDALAQYSFMTRAGFKLLAMGSEYGGRLPVAPQGSIYSKEQALDCGTESATLYFEFSEAIQPIALESLKRLVKFEPEIRNLEARVSRNRLSLSFDADRGTLYRLGASWQSIRSATGRELERFKDSAFWFYLRQAQPYLSWKSSNAVAETFGPQFMPLEGRGMGRVDLRVHRVDPLDFNFWPFPSSPIMIAENSRPPMPGEEPPEGQNIAGQIRLIGSPQISKIVDLPISVTAGRSSFGLDLKAELAAKFGKEEPGTYIVGIRTIDGGDKRSYARLVVTDLCLTTVEEENAVEFVVTSLRGGEPLAGVEVRLEGWDSRYSARRLVTLFSGKTDKDGHFRYEHRTALEIPTARIVVTRGKDTLVLDPSVPPPAFADNHWSSGSGGWMEWITYEVRQEKHRAKTKAWIITERPVYRPEESVHILGYVRDRKDGRIIRHAEAEGYEVYIRADGNDWTFPVELSGLGRFSLEFKDDDAPTGNFLAVVRGLESRSVLAQVEFKKEAYRVPSFKVDISGPDRVGLDKPFELEATADYYSGGRVVGQSVRWTVTQYPYSISSPVFPGYVFSTDERFSGAVPFTTTGSIAKEMELDDTGASRLKIDPSAEKDGRARRYAVEILVQGADRQTVTQTKQVLALPPFSIGLKAERFLTGTNSITPSLIVLDYAEKPLAGKKISLRLYQRQWHSYIAETDFTTGDAKYVSDIVDQLVSESSVVSGTAAVLPAFTAKEAGVYIIEAFASDDLGRRVSVKTDLFLAGPTPVSWQRGKSELFEMVPDRVSYVPGQKARLLIKSPFTEGWSLVVAERPDKNEYQWVRIANGQGFCDIAVDETMAPGFPVTAILERGRVPGTGSVDRAAKSDLGRPGSLGASIWVKVLPVSNQAVLALAHEAKARPASDLAVEISLKTPEGKPLDGEVSLWLVDKAVLSLGIEKPLDPLSAFLERARSWLRLRDTRNLTLGALPVEEVAGGDGADEFASIGDLLSKTTVRKNFKTVPYFNDNIAVKGGIAKITVQLPDNLTDFALRAVAVSGYDRFASAKSTVSVRLPVLVQESLPRFVRPGDKFIAGGIGRVTEGDGGPALAGIKVEGLAISGATTGATTGEDSRAFTLDAKKAEKLLFPLNAPMSLQESSAGATVAVSLFIQRNSDKARDAFRIELPVRDDVSRRRISALVLSEGATAVAMLEPPVPPRQGTLSRTLAVAKDPRYLKFILGLDYLSGYVHGCLEQRVSKLYPAVALKDLVASLGIPAYAPRKDQIPADFWSYLAACQDPDGLYAYWPGSQGYVSLTAYVVEFLVQAKAAGAPVPPGSLASATAALKRALRSDYPRLLSDYPLYERVEALAALDAADSWDASYANMLLDSAGNMQPYSQARLLSALVNRKLGNSSKAKDLAKRLAASVVTKTENGREIFAGLQDKSLPWGGPTLSSQVLTLAAMAEALSLADPSSTRTAILSDAVLAASGESGWSGTRDTIAALRLLGRFMNAAPAKNAEIKLELKSGTVTRTLSSPGKSVAVFPIAEAGPAALRIVSGAAKGAPLGLLMIVDYKPAARGSTAGAENSGFAINRELVLIGADGEEISRNPASSKAPTNLALDQVVEERVSLVSFGDRDFVAVTVPIAAGLEPLNPALAGAPKEAAPSRAPSLAPTYTLFLDDRVVYYYNRLPKGNYEFAFRARANFEGSFTEPQAVAELMYDPSVKGLSEGSELIIQPAPGK